MKDLKHNAERVLFCAADIKSGLVNVAKRLDINIDIDVENVDVIV